MGAKYEFKPDSNPGAGEYDVRESYQVVMGKNVGKKFLTGKRPGLINVKK